MPLFSEVPQQLINEKGDALNNSGSTSLETTASVEEEIMFTLSADHENIHTDANAKRHGSPNEAKEKDVINLLVSGKVLPGTRKRNTRENTDDKACREEHQHSDSSDDESSYFRDPRNLPHPKSDRRYSFSGSNAAPEGHQSHDPTNNATTPGPDLTLSFSEDSDEGQHHHSHHRHPQIPDMQGGYWGVPEPLLQTGVTRGRSQSSVLSGTGSDDDLSSDPSIRNEFNNTADQTRRLPTSVPSGRKSPVLGEHPPSRGLSSHSSVGLDPSPPTISNAYQQNRAYLHPQAQNMSQDQLANWIAAANAAYQWQLIGGNPYIVEDSKRSSSLQAGSLHSNTNTSEYSSDYLRGELNDSHVQNLPGSFIHRMGKKPLSTETEKSFESNESRNAGDRPTEPFGEHAFASAADKQRYQEINSEHDTGNRGNFQVYWKRWLMLMYMSVLNLLSDWTCYSVAPIALLTEQAFGSINPELLVTVFLVANAVASACEPIILSRLGLRRTVLFGALLLMIGSIIKSGGMPPIIEADLQKGQGEWRVYVGFLLVGLSQPLYQCTPALLSASWFPDVERTLATGIALNANQLGIGFAFIFGTLLVVDSNDIPPYFGLLSILSTVTFFGVLLQFEDAPPTPPSDSARVMKGTLEAKLPSVKSMFDSIRNIGVDRLEAESYSPPSKAFQNAYSQTKDTKLSQTLESSVARQQYASESGTVNSEKKSVFRETTPTAITRGDDTSSTVNANTVYPAPSPSNVGAVSTTSDGRKVENEEEQADFEDPVDPRIIHPYMMYGSVFPYGPNPFYGSGNALGAENLPYYPPHSLNDDDLSYLYPPYHYAAQQFHYSHQRFDHHSPHTFYGSLPRAQIHNYPPWDYEYGADQYVDTVDEGAEPVLILTPHHLDINIRDDQVLLSIKACMARRGFIHSLVSFTVSGVVINTLSTFMDYLVRLNGAGREYTGIVGGTFQFVIMISSLIVGKICDTTRAYYSITIFMLVLGAFGLAQCGVSLDEARGNDLRWALVIVALLVGPLQPISTELGVEVAYPLSENTVLVIQQLFSNLLSALFIPCFKAMKDISLGQADAGIPMSEKPEYTFSFYLLIVLHAGATLFFATFNGRYLRHDHEIEKANVSNRRTRYSGAFRHVDPETQSVTEYPNERIPLFSPEV